jgi:hypothetical protein
MGLDIFATLPRPNPWDPDFIFRGKPSGRHVATEPPLLSDAGYRMLDTYAELVPLDRRDDYRAAALSHLGPGRPGLGAVRAACVIASPGFIDHAVLEARGLSFNGHHRAEHRLPLTAPDVDDVGVW